LEVKKVAPKKVPLKPRRVICILLEGILLSSLLTTTAFAFTGSEYKSQAKVSLEQARAVALKTFPGRIDTEELEKESGGSGLRYSFVVSNKKVRHEVGVDAITGSVLENSVEGANPD